jgi:RNA polymerase sigma factor (sigma-70 family)
MKLSKTLSSATYKACIYFSPSVEQAEAVYTITLDKAGSDSSFPDYDPRKAGAWLYNTVRTIAANPPNAECKPVKKQEVVYNEGIFSVRYTTLPKLINEHYTYFCTTMTKHAKAKWQMGREDIRELISKTILRAYEYNNRNGWQPKSKNALGNLSSWLCVTMKNLHTDELRMDKRHNTTLTDEFQAGIAVERSSTMDFDNLMAFITNNLPERESKVLLLTYEGNSQREIKKLLDIPLATVNELLSNARKIVQKELKEKR